MLQMDRSPHDRLEGRAAKCSLIYLLDDATSEIMAARFEMSETTKGYFRLMEDHIVLHGSPLSLYIDKHGVFKVNHKGAISGNGLTHIRI